MNSPYMNAAPTVSVLMAKVMLALLPGIAAYVYYFGTAILVSLTLATVTALASEVIMLRLRRYPVKPFVFDGSAVVTAWLLALSLPPLAPWWLIVAGTAFAIVVAKHLYGGLGNNLFNPAMVGYAAMLISFPSHMTAWPAPSALHGLDLSLFQEFIYIFTGQVPAHGSLDGVTMATPLDTLKTQLRLEHTVEEIRQMPIFGSVAGHGGEIVSLMWLAGGLLLWQQRVISWQIPAAFLGALFATAMLFHVWDADRYVSPWFHLLSGGAMLGAFFIATDPVTGATTPRGKLIFGAGIGLLVYIIRTFGGYPDGVAFAVLLMNMCVPLIDAYTQPRVFGHATNKKRKDES